MTFNNLQIGKKFKMPSGVVYQKISTDQSKPIKKPDGTAVANGLVTTMFYNSKYQITETT